MSIGDNNSLETCTYVSQAGGQDSFMQIKLYSFIHSTSPLPCPLPFEYRDEVLLCSMSFAFNRWMKFCCVPCPLPFNRLMKFCCVPSPLPFNCWVKFFCVPCPLPSNAEIKFFRVPCPLSSIDG